MRNTRRRPGPSAAIVYISLYLFRFVHGCDRVVAAIFSPPLKQAFLWPYDHISI